MTFKSLIRKLKDEMYRIDSRSELAIKKLQTIAYKQKPTKDDIRTINEVIKLLEYRRNK